jgi:hypothetical protein
MYFFLNQAVTLTLSLTTFFPLREKSDIYHYKRMFFKGFFDGAQFLFCVTHFWVNEE